MEEELISVIIPVYDVEALLPLCMESVLRQTYRNLEIILVDDESPDGCPALCDAYARRDSRVRVIHKKNGGVADARNAALSWAKGRYLVFVDSDDSADVCCVEYLYRMLKQENADIAVCGWREIMPEQLAAPDETGAQPPGHGKPLRTEPVCMSDPAKTVVWNRKEALEALLYQQPIDTALWGKIFKRELFEGIRLPAGKHYEDFPVSYAVFERCGRVCYNPYPGYWYLQRSTGQTLGRFSERKLDLIDFADALKEEFLPRHPELADAVWSRFFRANCHIYLQIPDGGEYRAYRRRLEANIRQSRRYVLTNPKARRGSRIAAAVTYLGFPALRALRRWKGMGKR